MCSALRMCRRKHSINPKEVSREVQTEHECYYSTILLYVNTLHGYFNSAGKTSNVMLLSSSKNFTISSQSRWTINSLQRAIAFALSLFRASAYAFASASFLKAQSIKDWETLKVQVMMKIYMG